MSISLRSQYILLIAQTRRPDGHTRRETLDSLAEIQASIVTNETLSPHDRDICLREARDSIYMVQNATMWPLERRTGGSA